MCISDTRLVFCGECSNVLNFLVTGLFVFRRPHTKYSFLPFLCHSQLPPAPFSSSFFCSHFDADAVGLEKYRYCALFHLGRWGGWGKNVLKKVQNTHWDEDYKVQPHFHCHILLFMLSLVISFLPLWTEVYYFCIFPRSM